MVLIGTSLNWHIPTRVIHLYFVYIGIKGFLSDGRRGHIKVMFCFGALFRSCSLVSWIAADSSHNFVYRDVVMGLQWGHITILTAYLISTSQDFVYSLKFHHALIPGGRHHTLRALCINSRVFASIIVILPAFRCRTFLAPHPPPLVPLDSATLVSCCIP